MLSSARSRAARAALAGRRGFASASKPVASPAAAAASAAPAQAPAFESAAPSYTPSVIERLFFSSKAPRVPMDTPWPGLNLPAAAGGVARDLSSAPAQISTLANGMRVATLPSASPIASVGVFVDGGSRFETPETNGLTHFVERMSLKSTVNRSDFRLMRDMSKLGANVTASSGREHLIYAADCLSEHVPHVLGTMGDVIQHHAFDAQEIAEERERYAALAEQRDQIPDLKIMEAVHEAAYNGTGLGLSLYAPSHNLDSFTHDSLKSFTRQLFVPKRMVVSAVGVDHAELVALTNEVFNALPSSGEGLPKQPAVYTGGEVRMHKRSSEGSGLTHFALAFETASWHHKDLVPMCVLQIMMGGGGSFSAGGPGKGMYSRLYSNVLNKYDWAESCVSFHSIFTDSSLFGIYGTCLPDKAGALADVMSKELLRMTGPIDAVELSRAKNQLRSAIYMQLESRALKLEDTGRQVITYGKVQTAQELSAVIESVTVADLQRVAAALLKTPVTIAATGDLTSLPRYEQIQRAFK
jgi:processing peptidase subunit alpha